MTGGSVSRSAGILSRANELESLRKKQGTLEEKSAAAQREKEEAARELAAARYEMEVAEGQRRTAQDAVLKLQGQVDHYRSTLESLERSRESLEGERQALDQRVADSRRQMEETGGEIARQDAEAAALRAQVEEKLAGQTDLLALSGKLSEDVSARKEELSALAAEKEATAKALADMEQVCRDMEGDRLTRQRRLEEYRSAIEATEGEIDRRTEAAASLRLRGKGCQDRLTALREAKLLLEQERSAMGARIKSCNDAVLAAEREVARLEQKLSAGQWEEKQILDKLWETYELSHSAAMAQRIELESVPKANRRINELKREIGGLGNVNLEAIEDFDRINTRYTYLTGQRDDVEKAKGELVGVIEDLTREMTGIFARQFKLIDEAFRDTFRDLFGGGPGQAGAGGPGACAGLRHRHQGPAAGEGHEVPGAPLRRGEGGGGHRPVLRHFEGPPHALLRHGRDRRLPGRRQRGSASPATCAPSPTRPSSLSSPTGGAPWRRRTSSTA